MREVASNRMDSDYIILFLFVLVAPSATQQKTPATPATPTGTAGQVSTTSHEAEAETSVTFSTKATDPNPPKNVSWSPDFGPVLTFNFSVDGSADGCEVTVEGETFQDKNATGPCNNVTLSGLRNGTTYNMTVTVRRGDKSSVPQNFIFATKAAVPSEPGNFTAAETTNTSVTLTWSPPVPYPGHTNYTLIVTDHGSRNYETSKDVNKFAEIIIKGYDTWNYTVTGLQPAWNYTLALSAETEAPGFSNNVTTAIHTNDSAPGKVKNLNLTHGQVAYKQVVASWQCPDVTDRNTRITGFAVKTTPACIGDPCLPKLTMSDCQSQTRVIINVTAETQYTVEVQTLGEAYNSTEWAKASIYVPAGPSQKVENLRAISLNSSAVVVQWNKPHETNGALCGYNLVVLTDGVKDVRRICYKASKAKSGCFNSVSNILIETFEGTDLIASSLCIRSRTQRSCK